jgi:hypothetical protein
MGLTEVRISALPTPRQFGARMFNESSHFAKIFQDEISRWLRVDDLFRNIAVLRTSRDFKSA